MRNSKNPKFAGMSYEQASRTGEQLLKRAVETGNWHAIVDDLAELRDLMRVLGEHDLEKLLS